MAIKVLSIDAIAEDPEIRGGSPIGFGFAPSRRWDALGFRLARGQVSAQGGRSPGQGAPGSE